ncbi:hypothetical protein RJ639_011347 [Escallonia herrerae]|uniref:Senescence regulator n=1 Tax=Escallonia herrerae TaxID=1293975 RepID=A0AA89AU77_9ASTE|nr:hypothetical protein RJ639_011347 [Escallonia herrerae]
MAKGRKLTISRSERLLGSYGYGQGQNTINGGSELGEDDVWATVDEMVNSGDDHSVSSLSAWSPRSAAESVGEISSRQRYTQEHRHAAVGGLSLAFDDSGKTASPRILHQFRGHDAMSAAAGSPRGGHVASSAPVNVPDWTKIYRVESVESLHDSDDGLDDRDLDVVPPHEYLARSRNSAANSVFVGVGRTLKGRDLSRVRDAVWSQTGFDG